MSDRGRPHNLGQVLFESLGAGLGAYGSFLQNETERKSKFQQQSFLNRLREESGARSQERLGFERERLGLQREKNELSFLGKTSPNPFFQEEVSPQDQSLIDFRASQTSKNIRQTELLGQDTGQQKIPLGSFIQNFLGGRQRIVPGTEESLFPQLAPAPITSATVDSLGSLLQQLQGFGQSQVFPDIDSTDFLPAEDIPESAKAQISEGLRQRYGSEQWDSLSPEQKEAIIRKQFFNPQ